MKRNNLTESREEKVLDLEKSFLIHGSKNSSNNWSTAVESYLEVSTKGFNKEGEKKFYLSHECRSEDIAFSQVEGERTIFKNRLTGGGGEWLTITYDEKFYAYRSPSSLIGKTFFLDLEKEQVFTKVGDTHYEPGLPGTEENWISQARTYHSKITRYSYKELHELLSKQEINPRNVFCILKYEDQESDVECIFPARYINYKNKRNAPESPSYIQVISGYTLIWVEQTPIVGYLAAATPTDGTSDSIIECISSVYRDVGSCMAPEYKRVTVLKGDVNFFSYEKNINYGK